MTLSCIEPFSFDIENSSQPLVIESYISNVSYIESIEQPSVGYFFTTKLHYGQDIYGKGEKANGAIINLIEEGGGSWQYTEWESGEYRLFDTQFKASGSSRYKLEITLANNDRFESDWESLTAADHSVENLTFIETERFETRLSNGEKIIYEVKGIKLQVVVPKKSTSDKRYYMWQYKPTWIYEAGRLDSTSELFKCWVTGNSYLSQYHIGEDNSGGYKKNLVFIKTEPNERVLRKISILVKQFVITKEYFSFLEELMGQGESSNILATPPYNLKSNFRAINNDYPVFGYFSVRNEAAGRMFFSVDDLLYYVDKDVIKNNCLTARGPYGPDDPCDNCLNYRLGGTPSITPPEYWIRYDSLQLLLVD